MDRRPPMVDVAVATELEGPRGGAMWLMKLSCGHTLWMHGKRPRRRVQCVSCWMDANPGWDRE